jgi:hydroxymethylbilane synthase
MRPLTLGTRGSRLALRQAELTLSQLRERHPDAQFELRVVQTAGDRDRTRPISTIGDKGVFVRAIEYSLLVGEIDLAVHSLKDVPGDVSVAGLVLAAFSQREDPRDVLVSRAKLRLSELPAGARVGTGSPRRRAQLRAVRPDLTVADIRGNVDTRLRKLADEEYDAILVAAAGLHRLGARDMITEYLPVETFLPDAGQGIMVIQTRAGDEAQHIAAAIDSRTGRAAALAERAVARALDADCRSPIGALAEIDGDRMTIHAMASPDGTRIERASGAAAIAGAEALGLSVGRRLAAQLADSGTYTGA